MNKIADKIINHLRQYGDNRIKEYYYGEPLQIPASNLPCVIVLNDSVAIEQTNTAQDQITATYIVRLVFNKKDEIGKNPDEVVAARTMAEILMGRDSNGNYNTSSVVGILRTYFTLGEEIDNQLAQLQFTVGQRNDIITEEADLQLTVQDLITVASRQ